MGRSPSTFKQSDVERAVKAVRKAGLAVGAVEFNPDGKIRVEVEKVSKETECSVAYDGWEGKRNANEA